MRKIQITKVKEYKSKDGGREYYTPFKETFTNLDLANRNLAKKSKVVNKMIRELNQVASNIIFIGNNFYFDMDFSLEKTYYNLRLSIQQKIHTILHEIRGVSSDWLYNSQIKTLIDLLSDSIIWLTNNCKKIKYTGFEQQLQICQYSLDKIAIEYKITFNISSIEVNPFEINKNENLTFKNKQNE